MVEDRPNWRTGKLCYIEIPAVDVAASAGFYRPTDAEPGFGIYIMAAEMEAERDGG